MSEQGFFDIFTDAMRAEVMLEALKSLWIAVAAFIPTLVGALLIVIVGYIVAKILGRVTTVVLKRVRLDSASERVGLKDTLGRADIRASISQILGLIVFWVIMLTFLIPAAETLGLEKVSETIDSLIAYLPNVIGATLIIVIGLVIAHFVRNLVRSAAESIRFEYAEGVAKLANGVLIVIIAGLAIGQLKVEVALLNRVIEIVIIAAAAALTIALGLGSRELAHNLMAGFYAREQFKPGSSLTIGADSGTLEEVGTVNSKVKTSDGKMLYVPNHQLVESVVVSNQ